MTDDESAWRRAIRNRRHVFALEPMGTAIGFGVAILILVPAFLLSGVNPFGGSADAPGDSPSTTSTVVARSIDEVLGSRSEASEAFVVRYPESSKLEFLGAAEIICERWFDADSDWVAVRESLSELGTAGDPFTRRRDEWLYITVVLESYAEC